jgi:ABC-type phosphate/phosphonate transport system ATPase subunit
VEEVIMMLLVTASSRGFACAGLLEKALAQPLQVATNLLRATALLRRQDYGAIIVDEAIAEADPRSLEIMLKAAGNAVPVFVNLAISNSERIMREVCFALRRQEEFRVKAMRAAESQLGNELRDALTGILLSTELVLQSPELSPGSQEKLQAVRQLASHIRKRLDLGVRE